MIKVVIDTNVVVSANLVAAGPSAAILSLAIQRKIQMFISPTMLAEYEEVLNRPRLKFPKVAGKGSKAARKRNVYLSDARKAVSCPIYQRRDLGAGARIKGPALIEEHGTTTVLFEKDRCVVAKSGELLIDVGGAK